MTSAKRALLMLIPDARLRDIYTSRFEREGWEVESAGNITDAERKAVHLRPAILVMHHSILEDVQATFKRLRSLPTLLKTEIVVLEKHLSRSAIDAVLAAGATEVITTAHLTPGAVVKRLNQLIDEDL